MSNGGIREHLQTIYERNGRLTPELVVAEARSEDHPLHGYVFDREPHDAAEAWYRHRAHELIQSVRITYLEAPEAPARKIRAFHHVRTEDGSHIYEPAEKVASDPFLRELVLREMERDWKQLQKRYGEFEEFVAMVSRDVAA